MNVFNFTRHTPTVEIIETHYPETYKAIFDIGYARGRLQGLAEGKQVKAEADKIFMQGIEKVCADYWTEKAEHVQHSDACHSETPSGYASVEERARAEWDKNSNVRSEFVSFAPFLAYTKAYEAGQVRVCGA